MPPMAAPKAARGTLLFAPIAEYAPTQRQYPRASAETPARRHFDLQHPTNKKKIPTAICDRDLR